MGVLAYGRGDIYAALFDNDFVKIGITRDSDKRQRTLAAQGPASMLLWVVTEVPDGLTVHERTLHEMFKDKRAKGEYFRFAFEDWIELFTYFGNLEHAINNGLLERLYLYYQGEQ
jgi:hypothetical protein